MSYRRTPPNGFTLVEVLVVSPVMMLSIMLILSFMFNAFVDMSAKSAQLELDSDAQLALFTVRDDIMFANYFAGTVQPDANDPNKSGGWNAINDNALILSEASYTANRQSQNRELVYIKDSPNPCGSIDDGQNAFSTNTLIYFVENNTLYLRVIIPDQLNNCLSTYRKQTCPASVATPDCPADSVIATNVKDFSLTYYTHHDGEHDSSEPIDPATLTDPNAFVRVSRADINLTLERIVNAEPIEATATVSIKKVH